MMSIFGLDYVTGPPIDAMKAAGVAFVCRYLSEVNAQTQIKLLTLDEAKTLSEVGIAIVSNYEWYAERPLEGEASGIADAQIAESQHTVCGGPTDRPIYFSVDFDMTANEETAVASYFKGVASVIGLHRTGAYGSYSVLKYLFDNGLISYGWQTYAWSNGQWESRAQLQQYQNGVVMSGHSVDYDRAMTADYGQWMIGGTTSMIASATSGVPSGWRDDGTTLTAPNGIAVVLGFREYVLSHNWNPNNWPLMAQYHAKTLEISNQELGEGDQQIFHDTMLGYPDNPTGSVAHLKGQVIEEYVGDELYATRKAYAILYAEYQKLLTQPAQPAPDAAQLADLQSRLSVISGLYQQALPILQHIGTAATITK